MGWQDWIPHNQMGTTSCGSNNSRQGLPFIKIGSTREMAKCVGKEDAIGNYSLWSRVTKIFHKFATNEEAIKCQSAALPFCYLIAPRLSKPGQ